MTLKLTRREMIQGSLAAYSLAMLPSTFSSGAAADSTSGNAVIFDDDFSGFPAGQLTYPVGVMNTAIQENQWIDSRAHKFGAWSNGVADQDAWSASMEASTGKSYMQQQWFHPRHKVSAVLVTGEPEWADYTVSGRVKPLSFDGVAGIAFRYQSNLEYYVLGLTGGDTVVLNLQHPITTKFQEPNWERVASTSFPYTVQEYYELRAENDGPNIRAYVNGKKLLEVSNATLLGGQVGLSAEIPARFQDFRVEAAVPAREKIQSRIAARNAELDELRAENPKPKLWKKFSTAGFGSGSTVRFGDLDGDGRMDMLFCQNIQTISGDSFDLISCLTAVSLDGEVLWQSGRPNPRNGLVTNDNPFQIHDIDGDGQNEVVTVRDFQLQILDGRTGKIKKWAWMPKAPVAAQQHSPNDRPYELVFGDSLFFVNVSGNPARREILVKDRYQHFWIFDNDLRALWMGQGQTGHTPYLFDVNGYDRIMIGYSMWDHTGMQLWSHDTDLRDHADSVAVGNLSGDPAQAPRVYSTGSDEGFLMFDYQGNIMKHLMVGHAQSSSIGKYRMDLPGLQFMMCDFHWNPGIVLLFDWQGNILEWSEPIHNGSKLNPVNWRGDGQEFVLLSGDPHYGGMIDGYFRRVVMFPDDGHPDLCYFATDLTGDGRDEVILWDTETVWIYTQDRPFKGEKVYTPVRNPLYNMSNYSSIVSLPRWNSTVAGK